MIDKVIEAGDSVTLNFELRLADGSVIDSNFDAPAVSFTMGDGSLTSREKELVALGIGISKQCVDCIGFHMQSAIKAGATRDDIAETIGVAMMMGGGPAYMYGVKALEAYDQLS